MRALISEFSKMPGIGPKSAKRLAFFILRNPSEDAERLSGAILKVKSNVKFCEVCNNLSDTDVCDICANPARDRKTLCVVEKPSDVIAIEKMGEFNGVYHVLLGTLSPIDGIGPKDLKIEELVKRIKKEKINEVIVATSPNTEGEATALYLIKLLGPMGIKVYRIAYGMPVGSDLEYADQATLYKAFEGKKQV